MMKEEMIGHSDVVVHPRPRSVGDRLALQGSTVFDGAGGAPLRDATVLVEGGRVIAVGTRQQIGELPADWLVLDFPGHTILPGLIDCHLHLMLVGDGRPSESIMEESNELLLMRSARNAATNLAAGITTVRDLGTRDRVSFALRDAAEAGLTPSPRLLLAGRPVAMTGGHCYFFGGECDGVEAVRATTRQLLKEGADLIKIMATGGLTRGTGHHAPGLTVEEMAAAVQEAHRFRKLTAAHASSIEGMRNALDAGVDCLEHAVFLDNTGTLTFDEALAERIAEAGAFVSPTLQEAYRGVAALDEEPDKLSAGKRAELIALRERKIGNIRNAARLHRSGVRLVVSSDAGSRVTPHGDLAFGVELITQAGLSISEAVAAATGVAAQAAGVASEVGTLAPKQLADLLIVDGDVAADVRALGRVRAVFQGGLLAAERMEKGGLDGTF